jgi:hypothetical protein
MTTNQTTFLLRAAACVLVAGVMCLVAGAPARADFGIVDGTTSLTLSTTQAGAHPDVTTAFKLNTKAVAGKLKPDGSPRNIAVELPPGVVGDPAATPKCLEYQLTLYGCPVATQVGIGTISLLYPFGFVLPFPVAVYNLEPGAGQVAVFGFRVGSAFVHIVVNVRTGSDYGVTATIKDIPQIVTVVGTSLTLWGVPADPRHDPQRWLTGGYGPGDANGNPLPSGMPRTPFMTNPTSCGGPLSLAVRAESWQEAGHLVSATGPAPAITGCDKVRFDPSIRVRPDTFQAGAPAGYDVGVHVPQDPNPDGNESATLRDAVVTLPEGVVVSPSSADGLGACSQAQVDLHSPRAATCPDNAKLGTVRIDTPLLPDPLEGSIYLAEQGDRPGGGSNPFGSMLALYLVAEGSGVTVKLAGKIHADPATGRLTTTFADNPQLPFSDLKLRFHGGPRAALVNPSVCGTATSTAALTPHSSNLPATVTDAFEITGCGDPNRFAPAFSAGTLNTQAGASTPFTLTFGRDDADQVLSRISVTLPPGLLGRVGDVPRCANAAAAAGTCPAESRVGTAHVAAGPGTLPFGIDGAVYLTEGYRGGQYGLSVVVAAIAGPFDLGTVVVRQAIFIDPHDAHVTVVSDPLPTILRGIPLRIRQVSVLLDRPGFMLNPTSCAASQIAATVESDAGASASRAVPFRVGGCGDLGYAPALSLRLSGKGQTTDGKHPALSAHLVPRAGDANSRKVTVSLPLSLALDPDNANGLCEPADAAADNCPAASIVGHASAASILPDPLQGPVYFVRGERKDAKTGRVIKTLPKLYLPLSADGVTVYVNASSTVVGDRLVTTFDNLPDAPFSSFDLNIDGGKHGILVVSGADVCKSTQISDAQFTGQNRKVFDSSATMGTPCSLGVVAASHTSRVLKVSVGGIGPGKLSITAKGLTSAKRTIARATTATVSLPMNASVRRALAHGHNVRVTIKVSFTAQGTNVAQKINKRLIIHGAKRKSATK